MSEVCVAIPIPGPRGRDGVDGVDGVDGAPGATGPQGPAGADGSLTGAAGGDLTGNYPNPLIDLLKVTSAKMSTTGVVAGVYGSSSLIPILTVDVAGRITSAINAAFTAAPTGPAGGDLTGNYPNPSLLTVVATKGGTGHSTVTTGDLLYGSAANVWSKLAGVATGNALISGGVGVAPSWGKIGLTTHVTGVLDEVNGGTGTSTVAVGDLLYGSALNTWAKLAGVATGNVLLSGGVGVAPLWGQVGLTTHVTGILPVPNGGTGFGSYTIGDLLYADTANTLARLADVATGSVLVSGGVGAPPAWGTVPASGVTPGTANQMFATNAGATATEWRTLAGTTNQVNVAFGAGSVTLSTPQDIATVSSPTFGGLTVVGASGLVHTKPAAETGYGVYYLDDAAGIRRMEAVYVGTGAAPAYGIPAGGVGINANVGSLTFSTSDLARVVISAAGAVSIPGAITTSSLFTGTTALLSGHTATRVFYAGTGGLLSTDAGMVYSDAVQRLTIAGGGGSGIELTDGQLSVGASFNSGTLIFARDNAAQTTEIAGLYSSIASTSSTASIRKYGLHVDVNGSWSGAGSAVYGINVLANSVSCPTNYACFLDAINGTVNYAIYTARGDIRLGDSTVALGFFGATPVVRPAAYTPTNVTPDRSYDADTVTVAELADIVGTLIADMQAYGLLQ